MLIAHISDCHIVDRGGVVADRVDSAATLTATIRTIEQLDRRPDLVLATGDLVNDGTAAQYDHFDELMSVLSIPWIPLPGNHDDRAELRARHASLPAGGPADPLDHVADVDDARLVLLDTMIPGEHGGTLTGSQLAWLDARLGEAHDRPVIIAQHHPPFLCGAPWMDDSALDSIAEQRDVIAHHDHVVAVLAGHFHRPITVRLGQTLAWCAPSSAVQMDHHAATVTYTSEAPAFLLHELLDDGLLHTQLVNVADHDRWHPAWSL